MRDTYIRGFKKKILQEQKALLGQLQEFNRRLDLPEGESISELSSYDNHPGDLGTEVFERGKDFALREDVKTELAKMDEALERIDQGNYGRCLNCGGEISIPRLDAIPWTDLCDRCKDTESRQGDMPHSTNRVSTTWESERYTQERETVRRPAEEDILTPPFDAINNDDNDRAIYDGEDAWQDVARFSEHAADSGAGAYYGPEELDAEDRGYAEQVDNLPYFKGINGVIYRDYRDMDYNEDSDEDSR